MDKENSNKSCICDICKKTITKRQKAMHKLWQHTPGYREKMKAVQFKKGHEVPLEWRKAVSNTQKNKVESMETRIKKSMAHKKRWENPNESMINNLNYMKSKRLKHFPYSVRKKLSEKRKELIKNGLVKYFGNGIEIPSGKGTLNPFYGKKHTLQTKMKMSIFHADNKREKNPNWLGGINAKYPHNFNKNLKNFIRYRDCYQCMGCLKLEEDQIAENGKKLSIHHIDYNKNNNNVENLISLCHQCHAKTNTKNKREMFIDIWQFNMAQMMKVDFEKVKLWKQQLKMDG